MNEPGRVRFLRWLSGSGWPVIFGVLLGSSAGDRSFASWAAWCFAALFVTLLLDVVLPAVTTPASTPTTKGHSVAPETTTRRHQ